MPEGRKVGETTARTSSFASLKYMMPRQVMLSASSNSTTNGSKAAPALTVEQKKLLLQAVSQFLELNGFSKTLKKFLREAELEDDSSKNSPYNLEDMCSLYLAMRASRNSDNKNDKKLGKQNNEMTAEDNDTESIAAEVKAKEDKKKQSKTHSNGNDVEPSKKSDPIENSEKELQDGANIKSKEKKKKKSSNGSLPVVEDTPLEDAACHEKSSKKTKEKKKNKSGSDSSFENIEHKPEGLKEVKEEKSSKSKSEKKKKVNSPTEIVEDKCCENKQADEVKDPGHARQETQDGMKDKKSSKKRKRLSEENGGDNVEELKESSKTDGSSEMKDLGCEDKDNMVDSQTPAADKHSNGFLEHDGGDKSTVQKSSKKQKTGSSEPKSLNAFRRVDPDEVVFVDERLQDNSYWAKDGADSGYGAKAQEVLGQVRGRDFRHEKTKKKRGSYRGGQIDLDSHSIKFNYSDEDE